MKKRTLIVSGLLILLIIAALFVWKYSSQTNSSVKNPEKKLPAVSVSVVKSGRISRYISAEGTVEAAKIARMSSPAEGPIVECGASVREGDKVHTGQALICLGRDKSITAQLSAAKADITRDEKELDRVKKLVENGAIPGDQLEIARARFENVKAQVARLEESKTDFVVRAPWNGIVSKVMVVVGDFVPPRTPLVEIFDPSSLIVRFAIPESESQNIHIGNGHNISVSLDAYPGKTFQGRIVRIYPKLDPSTRTRLVEASLRESPPLTPGLFARIRMNVETHDNAVIIPQEAVVVNAAGERLTYVVNEGRVSARKITTGIEADGQIETINGLKPGEKIVIAGNEKLKDGSQVKLLENKDVSGDKKAGSGKQQAMPKEGEAK